jgi:D-alanyl-D-alanine carboxypeptidase
MNVLRVAYVVVFALLLTTAVFSCDGSQQSFQKTLDTWRHANVIPGVVVTFSNANSHTKTYMSGFSELSNRKPIKPQSLFLVGSITKTFISAAILKLEAGGKLSINDPIGKWFPHYPRWKAITISQLLNMTSGINRYGKDAGYQKLIKKNPQTYITDTQLLNIAYANADYFKPGTHWNYSNTDYILLGKIINKASGMSTAQFIKKTFIQPLQLAHTYYVDDRPPSSIQKKLAHGYYQGQDMTYLPTIGAAAGGMLSTTKDIAIWVRILFTNLLPEKQKSELINVYEYKNDFEPTGSAYGLGVFSLKTNKQGTIWWYTGVTNGYSMVFAWVPKQQQAFVIAINKTEPDNYLYLFPQKSLFIKSLAYLSSGFS